MPAHRPNLPADFARCDGHGSIEAGVQSWREGCATCLRRTPPRPATVEMIAPPAIIAFECEYLIEPPRPAGHSLT